jgi:hypothetical protein
LGSKAIQFFTKQSLSPIESLSMQGREMVPVEGCAVV